MDSGVKQISFLPRPCVNLDLENNGIISLHLKFNDANKVAQSSIYDVYYNLNIYSIDNEDKCESIKYYSNVVKYQSEYLHSIKIDTLFKMQKVNLNNQLTFRLKSNLKRLSKESYLIEVSQFIIKLNVIHLNNCLI